MKDNEIRIEPIEEIPKIKRVKKEKYKKLIDDFIESGFKYAKVVSRKNIFSVINSIRNTIKRYNLQNIKVMKRKNEVFLVRKDMGSGEDG